MKRQAPPGYASPAQTAAQPGVSESAAQIRALCRAGCVWGAEKVDGRWWVPSTDLLREVITAVQWEEEV